MLWAMSNYGQQQPYGQPPNPYGQQQPYATPPARPDQPPYGQQPNPYSQQPPYGQPQAYPPQAQPYAGQWPPQAPARPELVLRSTVVVTMETVPGRQIEEVLGDVIGVVARTRELRPDLRTGNPLDGYVTMLTESRQEAVARLVEMAENAGANAVVGLRFDCSEITQSLSEVAAYGTAVRLADEQASTGQTAGYAMSDTGVHPMSDTADVNAMSDTADVNAMSDAADVNAMSDAADVDAMSDTADHDFPPGWSEQFETRPGPTQQ
jgi:uncharacterized protein YbjQ (UPF0145 family)